MDEKSYRCGEPRPHPSVYRCHWKSCGSVPYTVKMAGPNCCGMGMIEKPSCSRSARRVLPMSNRSSSVLTMNFRSMRWSL